MPHLLSSNPGGVCGAKRNGPRAARRAQPRGCKPSQSPWGRQLINARKSRELRAFERFGIRKVRINPSRCGDVLRRRRRHRTRAASCVVGVLSCGGKMRPESQPLTHHNPWKRYASGRFGPQYQSKAVSQGFKSALARAKLLFQVPASPRLLQAGSTKRGPAPAP
jgi:hypothetical protein